METGAHSVFRTLCSLDSASFNLLASKFFSICSATDKDRLLEFLDHTVQIYQSYEFITPITEAIVITIVMVLMGNIKIYLMLFVCQLLC